MYRVIGTAVHTETFEEFIVYSPLYSSNTALWVRPKKMFLEKVINVEWKLVPRFEYIGN